MGMVVLKLFCKNSLRWKSVTFSILIDWSNLVVSLVSMSKTIFWQFHCPECWLLLKVVNFQEFKIKLLRSYSHTNKHQSHSNFVSLQKFTHSQPTDRWPRNFSSGERKNIRNTPLTVQWKTKFSTFTPIFFERQIEHWIIWISGNFFDNIQKFWQAIPQTITV